MSRHSASGQAFNTVSVVSRVTKCFRLSFTCEGGFTSSNGLLGISRLRTADRKNCFARFTVRPAVPLA